jgi:outer membrane protein TolC
MTVEYPLLNEAARRQSPALDVTRGISDLMLVRSREEVIFNTATVYYQALQTRAVVAGGECQY